MSFQTWNKQSFFSNLHRLSLRNHWDQWVYPHCRWSRVQVAAQDPEDWPARCSSPQPAERTAADLHQEGSLCTPQLRCRTDTSRGHYFKHCLLIRPCGRCAWAHIYSQTVAYQYCWEAWWRWWWSLWWISCVTEESCCLACSHCCSWMSYHYWPRSPPLGSLHRIWAETVWTLRCCICATFTSVIHQVSICRLFGH